MNLEPFYSLACNAPGHPGLPQLHSVCAPGVPPVRRGDPGVRIWIEIGMEWVLSKPNLCCFATKLSLTPF